MKNMNESIYRTQVNLNRIRVPDTWSAFHTRLDAPVRSAAEAPLKERIQDAWRRRRNRYRWVLVANASLAVLLVLLLFAQGIFPIPRETPVANPNAIVEMDAGLYYYLTRTAGGDVRYVGENLYQEGDVDGWSDIIDIDAGYNLSAGVTKDGKVLLAGSFENQDVSLVNYIPGTEFDVSDWDDIVQVAAGQYYIAGLKSDGTVRATTVNSSPAIPGNPTIVEQVESWTDIVKIDAHVTQIIGLKKDGTVVAAGNSAGEGNVQDWTDIVDIEAGTAFSLGLKDDGTVVYTGLMDWRTEKSDLDTYHLEDWTDIVDLAAGNHLIAGLKKDGTVLVAGSESTTTSNIRLHTASWTDMTAIALQDTYLVGLKEDGSIVSTDGSFEYTEQEEPSIQTFVQISDAAALSVLLEDGTVHSIARFEDQELDTKAWENIVGIDSEGQMLVGLAQDGTARFCTSHSESDLMERFMDSETQDEWKNLVGVTAGENLIAGLKNDGTVVVLDSALFPHSSEVKEWAETHTNIVDMDGGGNYFILLRGDGSVDLDSVVGLETPVGTPIDEWENVMAVSAGAQHALGLKSDGTVFAFGDPDSGILAAETWTDIVRVSAGRTFCAGLKGDGTVVFAGNLPNSEIVPFWTGIVQISAGVDLIGLTSDGVLVSSNPDIDVNDLN